MKLCILLLTVAFVATAQATVAEAPKAEGEAALKLGLGFGRADFSKAFEVLGKLANTLLFKKNVLPAPSVIPNGNPNGLYGQAYPIDNGYNNLYGQAYPIGRGLSHLYGQAYPIGRGLSHLYGQAYPIGRGLSHLNGQAYPVATGNGALRKRRHVENPQLGSKKHIIDHCFQEVYGLDTGTIDKLTWKDVGHLLQNFVNGAKAFVDCVYHARTPQ